MNCDHPRHPAHLDPYVEILGVDGAVSFFLKFGGGALYFAKTPGGRSEAEAFVGRDEWRALTERIGNLSVRVPIPKRWIAHVLHRKRGLPVGRIASTLHVSDVTVRRYLGEPSDSSSSKPVAPRDSRQLKLL